MKKAIKFLLFVIALFVTVNVKALQEDIRIDGNYNILEGISFKSVYGDSNSYAFCIDRAKGFTTHYSYRILNENVLTDIDKESNQKYEIYSSKIRNVIIKAYLDGLGTDNNVYGLSNDELYAVTQMAVWHAAHGNRQQGMYNNVYASWLDEKPIRRQVYNTLVSVEDVNQIVGNEFSFSSDDIKMNLSSDSKYYVSDEISINGSGNLTYTVKASDGACVLYNGKCDSTATVKAGEKFSLRTDNNSDKISVSASVVSSTFLSGYEFSLYTPHGVEPAADDVNQRTAVFVPVFDKHEGNVSADVDNTVTTKTKDLKVSKTDATNQAEIGGAEIYIYDLDGEEFTHWTSEEGKTHYVKDLVVDKIYRLEETVAPVGYDKLTTDIYFKVSEDGSVTTCKADVVKSNGTCEAMSTEEILNIKNYPTKVEVKTGKVVISKKDFTNGEEIPGAHLQIIDDNGQVVAEWTSTTEPHEIELPVGKYTLVETIPATNYDSEMIIDGDRTSRYEFEITEDGMSKIDVYNQLKGKIIDTPITGMSVTSLYVIGGLVTLAGASVVVYAKKKENM